MNIDKEKNKNLTKITGEIAELTGNIDFEILHKYMDTRDNITEFVEATVNNTVNIEEKKKILNFLKQLNNLIKDFLKEMNINE